MTYILNNNQTHQQYFFESDDELTTWIEDCIDTKDRQNWEIIDEEGGVFYV